jgi:diguanylate cyclase (GGDEF)-like protein
MENKEQLVKISESVKRQIADIDIMPPLLYKTFFVSLLEEQNIVLENEETLVDTIIHNKLLRLSSLQKHTASHLVQLENSTKNAVDAIRDKDELKLEKVLGEALMLRREIEKLKISAFTDMLTKAHNRQWLYAHYLNQAEEFTCKGVLAFVDMNLLQEINKAYGHIAGDKVLEFTAIHLKKAGADLIRYGGDEFLLMFENANKEEVVESIVENNRGMILKKELIFKENRFKTSYCYGVVAFEVGNTLHEVLVKADEKLYKNREKFEKNMASPVETTA